jgi:hypothetical protein
MMSESKMGWTIRCTGCLSRGQQVFMEAEAIAAWNTRAALPSTTAVAEMREAAAKVADEIERECAEDVREWGSDDQRSSDLAFGGKLEAHRIAKSIRALPLPAGEGWEPIESAPRDGRDVLIWVVHPNAQYADTVAAKSDWQGPVVARWIEHNGGGWTWHGITGRFTHWRPLPAPPAESPQG